MINVEFQSPVLNLVLYVSNILVLQPSLNKAPDWEELSVCLQDFLFCEFTVYQPQISYGLPVLVNIKQLISASGLKTLSTSIFSLIHA